MAKLMGYKIDIYMEGKSEPLMSHIFYGRSDKVVRELIRAHIKWDTFFRAAMEDGKFRGVALKTDAYWVEY